MTTLYKGPMSSVSSSTCAAIVPSEIIQWQDWVNPILEFASRMFASEPFLYPHTSSTLTALLETANQRVTLLSSSAPLSELNTHYITLLTDMIAHLKLANIHDSTVRNSQHAISDQCQKLLNLRHAPALASLALEARKSPSSQTHQEK